MPSWSLTIAAISGPTPPSCEWPNASTLPSQLGGVGPLIAAMVKDQLGMKVHWTVPDYLQRSARHLASKTDLAQALAVGTAGVEYALAGMNGVMPVIRRLSDSPYRWRVEPAPLTAIANHEKKMPA